MAGPREHARRSSPRLPRSWKVTSRLRLIVAAPLVAVVGFAGVALSTNASQARRATGLGDLISLSAAAGDLAHSLGRERAGAATLLTSVGDDRLDAFLAQVASTDAAARRYQRRRGALTGVAAGTDTLLGRIDSGLSGLENLRRQTRSAERASVSSVAFGYRIIVADLLEFREAMAQVGAFTGLADRIRAASALSDAIEAAGQQQVTVVRAIATGELMPAMQAEITAARTSFTDAGLAFTSLATRAWNTGWERAGSGQEALAAQRLQDQVGRALPGTTLDVNPDAWVTAIDALAARLHELERRVDAELLASVFSTRGQLFRQVGVEAVAMGLALVLTMLVTTAVARHITRQLRDLRDSANRVAFERLPAVVKELRTASPSTIEPETIAGRSAGSLLRSSRGRDQGEFDEIGEVAQAFSEVHRAAVRTAAEQAIMRSNMAEIFVHLSRREQRLVDAVLAKVDVVESDETDPERLRHLYELDNLATRMGRVNASLLVLGGVGVGRVRGEDIPLTKILQAALSQIQHYTRVRFGVIDAGVAAAAEHVDDIVHLLAELMDNATAYSPPECEAWVTARSLGDRVIVQIGDEGVGLPAARRAQLNDVLARPPAIDIAAVRSMGLVVVGHLAARFGARVELRPGPRLGTIAEVTLPSSAFRPLSEPVPAPPTAPPPWPLPEGHGKTGRPARGSEKGNPLGAGPTDDPNSGTDDPDRTTELPIFQQVNSWFRPGTEEGGGRDAAGQPAKAAARGRLDDGRSETMGHPDAQGSPKRRTGQGAGTGSAGAWRAREDGGIATGPMGGPGRGPVRQLGGGRTGSDEAWRAATALAEVQELMVTPAGLPQRVPNQRLVPAAMDQAEQQRRADLRDPSRVAAALAAYARGVAGRQSSPVAASTTIPGSTP